MKILYYIQCSCLVALTALATCALIYWHPWMADVAAQHDGLAQVEHWEYDTFEWRDLQFEDSHPDEVLSSFIDFPNDDDWHKAFGANGREVATLAAALNALGEHGWELICFDGHKYIVKRPDNQHEAHAFVIEQHWHVRAETK